MTWPDSISGWCFRASPWALLTVVGATLLVPIVMQIAGEGGVEVLWKIVEFGFVTMIGSFILGVIFSRLEDIRRKSARG